MKSKFKFFDILELSPQINECVNPSFVSVAPARVDDEWHKIRKCRKYLIKEMDAIKMMKILSSKEVQLTKYTVFKKTGSRNNSLIWQKIIF